MLAKTFGLILYKEQAALLINELLQNNDAVLPNTDFLNQDKFIESLKTEYKKALSEREKNAIYVGLLRYSEIDLNSYAWCRSLAESIKKEG